MNRPQFLAALILTSERPAKLAAFYRDRLGIPLERRDAKTFSAMLGDTHFAIHAIARGRRPTRAAEIGLQFADLDGLVADLTKKRVALDSPIQDFPWARSAQLTDPEGNVVYLMSLPSTSLAQLERARKPRGSK